MRLERCGATLGLFACLVVGCTAKKPTPDLDALLRSRQWFELRAAASERSPALIRGALAAAFNDPERAERLLRGVIDAQPRQAAADDAYALLSDIYKRSGRYHRYAANFAAWAAAYPDSDEVKRERGDVARFGDRPDQLDPDRRHAVLRHDDDSFTLPATVNGMTTEFLVDTGAGVSVLTDVRAKALGLTIGKETGVLNGSSGTATPFRTAVASEVVVGEMRFRDVSFAVLSDGAFAGVDAGIIGLPMLPALGVIRWSRDGTIEIGGRNPSVSSSATNLAFDRGRLLLRTSVLERDVLMTLDTGAITTDLNANFADRLQELTAQGKKGTHAITGVGGTTTFDSVEIPEVTFAIGATRVGLRPAHVTLQRVKTIGGECCVGNAGHDLLNQQASFTLDFDAMTLELR